MDVQIEEIDYFKLGRDLPDLGDEVRDLDHIDCLRIHFTDLLVYNQIVSAPFEYLTSLPSKRVRD